MKKIPTQYREQVARAQWAKRQVMRLLGWSDVDFSEFQYKCGCAYLQAYIPRDPQGIDMLVASRLFWNWWKNRWAERDYRFIATDWAEVDQPGRQALYRVLHSPEDLANAIYPNSVVLHNSYAKMIGELNDSKR